MWTYVHREFFYHIWAVYQCAELQIMLFATLWLNDRQPVKVFKTLNDRQKNRSDLNYHMSIRKCQAIFEKDACLCLSVLKSSREKNLIDFVCSAKMINDECEDNIACDSRIL